VWAEVELAADRDWQSEANKRGTNAQGKLIPVRAHITDQLPEDGYYRYKTNPNMTGNWLISGSMKVNRILSDEEVRAINAEAGVADLPRQKPFDAARYGFSDDLVLGDKVIETSEPAFKRWFGDSKVVGPDGKPLVVYHGTVSDFETFTRDSHFGTYRAANQRAKTWGTDKPTKIMPVYLRIENPLRVLDNEASDEAALLNSIKRGEYPQLDLSIANNEGAYFAAKKAGYDGLVYKNRVEDKGKLSYVAFDPNQIKSIFNKGTYNPESDYILEDKLSETAEQVKEKAKQALQKRGPLKLAPQVSAEAAEKLQQTFAPENKTIIDKIEGLKDRFWQRMSQGIADQFRSIKEYDEKTYMQARLSKSVDGGREDSLYP
jgi:hypothetical protein